MAFRYIMMKSALILGAAICLMACGGQGSADALQPTLADLQQHVFQPACATSGCHDAIDAAGELDMSTAQISYDAMVGIPSKNPVAKANGWVLIRPTDPERSFLVRKLVGPGVGEGDPMPSAAQALHPYYVEVIEQWIQEGAPR